MNDWERKAKTAKCDVRLDIEEDKMLNELSERNGVSRSDVMRRALRDLWAFNNEDVVDVTNEE